MNNPEDSKQAGATNQTAVAPEGCAQAPCSASRRIQKPWERALKKFIPIMFMACATVAKEWWVVIVYPVLAYLILWMNEKNDE